jgi:hypothetical protein
MGLQILPNDDPSQGMGDKVDFPGFILSATLNGTIKMILCDACD